MIIRLGPHVGLCRGWGWGPRGVLLLPLSLLLLSLSCIPSPIPSTSCRAHAQPQPSTLTASQHHRRGIQLAQDKQLEQAIQHLQHAVTLSPSSAEYINNLGVVQLRRHDLEAAKQSFEKALQLQPGHASALKNVAEIARLQSKLSSTSTSTSTSASTSTSTRQFDEDDDESESESEAEAEPRPPQKQARKKTRKKERKSQKNTEKHNPNPDHYPDPPHWSRRRANTNKRDPLPHIPLSQLYLPENKDYAEGKLPFIVTEGMSKWDTTSVWSFEQLTSRFPTAIVDFYPHNMDDAGAHPYLTELSTALHEFYTPTSAYPHNNVHPGTYIQWNVNYYDWRNLSISMPTLPYAFRRDDEWLESCFSTEDMANEFSKKTHWRMILIGTKGAGMFNHQDVLRTASWQAQLTGAKRWHICAPNQSQYLYGAGKVDVWDVDYEKYPLFHHAHCYEDIVHGGEMIFYPKDYWHQTENLKTPSISISASILDEDNYDEISAELRAECSFQKYKWQFSTQLCRELETCYEWWEHRLGNNHRHETCTSY